MDGPRARSAGPLDSEALEECSEEGALQARMGDPKGLSQETKPTPPRLLPNTCLSAKGHAKPHSPSFQQALRRKGRCGHAGQSGDRQVVHTSWWAGCAQEGPCNLRPTTRQLLRLQRHSERQQDPPPQVQTLRADGRSSHAPPLLVHTHACFMISLHTWKTAFKRHS